MPRSDAELDHLVVTAPVLADGVAWVEAALGVKMQAGGKHPHMGTHNALLRLAGSTYLEVIAVDPDVLAPGRQRWFGLDDFAPDTPPRLTTWVARVDAVVAAAAASTEPLGSVEAMERGDFAWLITIPADGRPPLDGLMPSLIEWSIRHPAIGLEDRGCRLARLEARHPRPERVRAALASIGISDVVVVSTTEGERPRLVAIIETPDGPRRL